MQMKERGGDLVVATLAERIGAEEVDRLLAQAEEELRDRSFGAPASR